MSKPKTRQNEHSEDVAAFDKHVVTGQTEGGACLTGHNSRRNRRGRLAVSSCNYRWQAYRRALEDDSTYYNSPKYASLCDQDEPRVTRVRGGVATVVKLKDGAWDVTATGDNFQTSSNTPYWHEAHHIVPHGELREAIAAVGKGDKADDYRRLIRNGLLDEKYNLNHKVNMIILPLDDHVARALDLPRHRHTSQHISHRAYSDHVRGLLNEVFKSIRQDEAQHAALPKYAASREAIEKISSSMREQIRKAGGKVSLDEAFAPASDIPS